MAMFITSIISQITNPWQYACIGSVWLYILYFDIEEKYIFPSLLIAVSIGYTLPLFFKSCKNTFSKLLSIYNQLNTLKKLKSCTLQEKKFLYNRVYENDNDTLIQLCEDPYFYKKKARSSYGGGFTYTFYKPEFQSKKQILQFLRSLENKKIIQ